MGEIRETSRGFLMEEKKPIVSEEEVLRVSLAQPGQEAVTVRAKLSTPVSKLINAYAQSANLDPQVLRLFSSEGERMEPTRTLGDYGIQDNDQLDVNLSQIGGRN